MGELNDTTDSSGGGVALVSGDTSMKAANNNCNDTTQKFPQSSNFKMRDANNCRNRKFDTMQDDSSCSDSSCDSDEEDISEIVDLQKALEHLVSERDIEKIYNDIISTSHSVPRDSSTSQSNTNQEKNTNDNDEQLL